MAQINIQTTIFDPIRFTTETQVPRFIVDTWFDHGLISRKLFNQLPGIGTAGTGRVELSSGMYIEQPKTKIGIGINNIRALPLEVFVVDDGPAPLLLGSDFIRLLFNIGAKVDDLSIPHVTLETSEKRREDSIGIRLIPESKTIDAIELEKFIRNVRTIHNVAVIAKTGMHQHENWPSNNIDSPQSRQQSKICAVENTILNDENLWSEKQLTITWVESGSIWLSLSSGAKSALSWITQLFEKSMDARLQSLMAKASTEEEAAAVQKMTREQIAEAKAWEQRRLAANNFRRTREEWRKTILGEIDFNKKLNETIHDPVVKEAAQKELDKAVKGLLSINFMPLVEHVPVISIEERDYLVVKNANSGNDGRPTM